MQESCLLAHATDTPHHPAIQVPPATAQVLVPVHSYQQSLCSQSHAGTRPESAAGLPGTPQWRQGVGAGGGDRAVVQLWQAAEFA
jgi:hypothetical protein